MDWRNFKGTDCLICNKPIFYAAKQDSQVKPIIDSQGNQSYRHLCANCGNWSHTVCMIKFRRNNYICFNCFWDKPRLDWFEEFAYQNTEETGSLQRSFVIVLSALVGLQSIEQIHKFTHYPEDFIQERLQRLIDNTILKDGKIRLEDEAGPLSFLLPAMCAEGLLKREEVTDGH